MSKRKEINVSKNELAKQQIYIDKIRKMNDEYYKRTGKRKKHLTLTFGCQMNSLRCIFISQLSSLSINKPMGNSIHKLN
jgi:hypothetical protein